MTEFALAFSAGLLGGAHCVGMCGGFVLAVAAGGQRGWLFHVGRVAGYALVGALAGLVGRSVDLAGSAVGVHQVRFLLSAALLLAFGLAFLGLLPRRWLEPGAGALARLLARVLRRRGALTPVVLGALLGLLPCGLLYPMYALAAGSGSPLRGAALLVTFGLGTVPLLGGASLVLERAGLRARERFLRVAGIVMLAMAGWLAWQGLVGGSGHGAAGPHGPPAPHQTHGMD